MKNNIKAFSIVIFVFAIMVLYGCTTEYERSDIIQYVKDNYDIKRFTVSKDYEEYEGKDGYTDKIWTVKVKGDDKLTFHVHDNFYWGMEALTNSLQDDYESVLVKYLYEEYDECELLELYTEEDKILYTRLEGEFSDKDELQALFEEAGKFAEYIDERGYDVEFSVKFKHENPLRNRCEYIVDDGDYNGYIGESDDLEECYANACKEYLLTCLDYRFENQLSEFSDDEIEEALEDYRYCISISRKGETTDEYEYYEDLCASKYAYGVSFATLYEILVREGFDVSGDSWHYSFTGADGSIYEISYDFCDYDYYDDYDYSIRNGYYYMKNGEQVEMKAYFYNHFWTRQIEEMTGLVLDIGAA